MGCHFEGFCYQIKSLAAGAADSVVVADFVGAADSVEVADFVGLVEAVG